MRIAVLSDTHGRLREDIEKELKAFDTIIHAGDFDDEYTYRKISGGLNAFLGVRGNCDYWAYGDLLPYYRKVTPEGVKIFITHRPEDCGRYMDDDCDIVITGHTHKRREELKKGILYLNPGSLSEPRDNEPGYCILEIKDGMYSVSWRDLRRKGAAFVQPDAESIRKIMKYTDKGLSIDMIADKTGLTKESVERTVRMYLTHPGVDVDGIMDRLMK